MSNLGNNISDLTHRSAELDKLIDSLLPSGSESAANAAHNMNTPLLGPTIDRMKQGWQGVSQAKLPNGISGSKAAAIVAGIAVAGGALYALTRKKKEPVSTWTGRVDAERASAPGQNTGR
ncbi:MAG: hypothetical protein GC184_13700 [Rhizobiales bacterium]|nr:hypothetical protein [Hyphomicrobiales bacterium]